MERMRSTPKKIICSVFIFGCILWYASFLHEHDTVVRSTKKPNIVFILADDLDPEMDGIDMLKALSMNRKSPRKEFIYNIIDRPYPSESIRVGDYKLINGACGEFACRVPPPETDGKLGTSYCFPVWRHDGVYLYNLKDDPTEHHNLAEKMPDKVRMLTRRLQKYKSKQVPSFNKSSIDVSKAHPDNFGGVWSTGWC